MNTRNELFRQLHPKLYEIGKIITENIGFVSLALRQVALNLAAADTWYIG